MKNNLEITEQDIFRSVFFRDELSQEKREYLKKNKKYENQIMYYESIKNTISSKISTRLQSKIASKIPSYKSAKVFFLSPRNYGKETAGNDTLIFAAKSANEPSKLNSTTFVDEEGIILVRKVSTENSTKLYIFSTKDEQIQNFVIKILPGGEEYHLKDNSTSLEVARNIKIKSIELKFE